MFLRITLLLVGCLVSRVAFPQAAPVGSKWIPQGTFSDVISLQYLCVAKMSKDGKSVQIRVPQYVQETRTQSYTVLVPYTETIEQEVKVGDEVKTKTITVEKKREETRTREYVVSSPAGVNQVNAPAESVRAWTLTGNRLDAKTLAFKLLLPVHVYAVQVASTETYQPIEPYFAAVMQTETLVLFYELPGDLNDAVPAPAPD